MLKRNITNSGNKNKLCLAKQTAENKNTALVVWGTNLTSTVGIRYSRTELADVKLPIYHRDVIVGLLLSDGYLRFANSRSKNVRLELTQSLDNSGYLWFVFSILSYCCMAYPMYRNRNRLGKIHCSIAMTTRALPCLTVLYSKFYLNGLKIVPTDIYNMLTPVALAHLIMGDGTSDHGNGVILCTDSFNLKDVIILMNVLIIRYKLECTLRLHGSNPRIYIRKRSMPLLLSIVTPYFHSSMLYKIR